ncbi:MAG: hypothetical protein HC877_16085 [Thioploca sp.]|nr:hypothetical protein [Thioploca sp.]
MGKHQDFYPIQQVVDGYTCYQAFDAAIAQTNADFGATIPIPELVHTLFLKPVRVCRAFPFPSGVDKILNHAENSNVLT